MKPDEAKEIFLDLLDAAKDDDLQRISSYNPPPVVVLLLERLAVIAKEINNLEAVIDRKREEETNINNQLLVEIHKMG